MALYSYIFIYWKLEQHRVQSPRRLDPYSWSSLLKSSSADTIHPSIHPTEQPNRLTKLLFQFKPINNAYNHHQPVRDSLPESATSLFCNYRESLSSHAHHPELISVLLYISLPIIVGSNNNHDDDDG